MLRVFIVDDEEIVRSAVRHILTEAFPSTLQIQLCRNGLEALRQANAVPPDIVFMDIKMPGMSGIETAKRLIQLYPRVGIIFLSAYEEFSFVQEAISMGAREYLTKPINRRKVLAIFERVRKQISEIADKEDALISLRNEVLMSRPLIEEHLVFSAILGNRQIGPELFELTEVRDAFNTRARVLTIQYRNLKIHKDETADLFPRSVYNELRDSLKEGFSLLVGAVILDTFTTILFSTSSDKISSLHRMLQDHAAHESLYAGLGPETANADGLHASYEGSIEALHQRIIPGMEIAATVTPEASPLSAPVTLENMPLTEAKARACERAASLVCSRKNPNLLAPEIRSGEYLQDLMSAESVAELTSRMKEFLARFQHKPDLPAELPRLINQARNLIDEEYGEEISLEIVADKLNVNPTYLSARFKECCGNTFTWYLTSKRMEAAAQMLAQSDASIKEIAHRCGFNDANYFSRTFKNWFGKSPSQYRDEPA